MKAYADGVGLSTAQVMQNFLIKRLAEDAAEETVHGPAPRVLLELQMTSKGLVTGQELFNVLYNDKVAELYRERARQIRRDVENGLPESALTDEDREVLKKYGG
jgi:hypothetical protein